MNKFNAYNLILLRERSGWSQSELAQQLGVKQAVLSKYERGAIEPPEEMRHKISEIFDYPVDFFERESDFIPSGLVHHRKRSALTAKDRNRIEAEARLRLMDVNLLATSQNIQTTGLFARADMTPENVATHLRALWKIPEGPVANLTKLLEEHNIIVLPFDFQTDKIDGFYICLTSGLVCIALNTCEDLAPDRNRFTLAHEFGHVLLHKNILPDRQTEQEADAFAAEFLMPECTIRADLEPPITFERLMELKAKWKVSIGALLYRANKLEIISSFEYRKFWMFMSSSGYRKNEPRCGIERETPTLLDRMLATQRQETSDLPKLFHLSKSAFAQRYPEYAHLTKGDIN